MNRSRVIFLTPANIVVFEGETDSRGRCDDDAVALNLLLRGVSTGRAASKLRVFVERKGAASRLRTAIDKLGFKIRADLKMTDKDLSSRQRQVADMLCRYASNKEIANALHITERTVKFHVSAMLFKFGCKNRRELGMRLVARFAGADAQPMVAEAAAAELAEVRPN